jgi:DNA-binding PadR family transcriptional regulator
VKTVGGWGSPDRSLLVLTSLAAGPEHGWVLIKDVESFSGVRLGPGTLYGCLFKLETAGLIEALPAEDRRHPYRVTEAGLKVLREQLSLSARIAQVGLGRVAGAGRVKGRRCLRLVF